MRRVIGWLIWGSCVIWLMACGRTEGGRPAPAPTATPVTVSQWAVAAQASSAFGKPDWSPARAADAPEIDACVDDSRAWASARGGGVEWLELTYAQPVFATGVEVYQTYGRGAVSRVSLVDIEGNETIIWEGVDETEPCPGALAVAIPQTSYRVRGVRIDLDESRLGYWNQIDAVALIGVEP